MKYLFLFLSLITIVFYSCKKEEDPEINQDPPQPQGCIVQNILAYNLTPIYEYKYSTEFPTRLESYKIRSAATGDVTHSYKIHYDQFIPDADQVDTVTH